MLTADGTAFHEVADVEPAWTGLTPREREVAELMCHGHGRNAIASFLGCKPNTVDTHRLHVMTKLDVENAVQLLRIALEKGWVRL